METKKTKKLPSFVAYWRDGNTRITILTKGKPFLIAMHEVSFTDDIIFLIDAEQSGVRLDIKTNEIATLHDTYTGVKMELTFPEKSDMTPGTYYLKKDI